MRKITILALLFVLSCSARIPSPVPAPVDPDPQGPAEVSFTPGSGMTFDVFGQFHAGLEAVYPVGQKLNTSTKIIDIPPGYTKFHFRAGTITVKCPRNMGSVEVAATGLFAIHLPLNPTGIGQVIAAPVLSCQNYPANGVIPAFTVNLQQATEGPDGPIRWESRHVYIQFQEVGDRRDTPTGMEIQITGWLE